MGWPLRQRVDGQTPVSELAKGFAPMNYAIVDTATGDDVALFTSLVPALHAVHRRNCHALAWAGELVKIV